MWLAASQWPEMVRRISHHPIERLRVLSQQCLGAVKCKKSLVPAKFRHLTKEQSLQTKLTRYTQSVEDRSDADHAKKEMICGI